MKIKDKGFKLLVDKLIEDIPEDDMWVDEDSDLKLLFIGDTVTVTKEDDILNVSFNLDTHPNFVASFIETLISLQLTYDIYESYKVDPETYETTFESQLVDNEDFVVESSTVH